MLLTLLVLLPPVQQKLIQSTNYGATFYIIFNLKTAATVVV